MSRIGLQPVECPKDVTVTITGGQVTIKGPKGELTVELPEAISVKQEKNQLLVSRSSERKPVRSVHGTIRSILANHMEGVTQGFSRELEIQGIGFKAQLQGQDLVMQVGYSHHVEFTAPEGITFNVPDPTRIIVSGIDKQLVGDAGARIRKSCPSEPYKGKGIRYKGEYVRRKVGKTVA